MNKAWWLLLVPVAAAAELPITKVVIYKNGVAYFERSGDVPGKEAARLEFKASEMDDVLKSLVIDDPAGVARLRYEMNEPLPKKLADLPVQLQPQQALVLLLDQWKGAQIEVRTGTNTVRGTIVSGRLAPLAEQGQKQELTVLTANGEFVVMDLGMMTGLRLQDPSLQAQVTEALTAMHQSRLREKRVVFVDSVSDTARRIAARYLTPAPYWKSTYRLMVGDGGEPLLEGWALVDNASGEDWTNVDLTVVSGRPVSFVSKLYEPRYVNRVTAELAEQRAAAPLVHEGTVAMEMAADARFNRPMAKREAGIAGGVPGGVAGGVIGGIVGSIPSAAPPPPPQAALSMVAVTAQGREVGELFEYRFPSRVSAKKGESAMIPFVQQKVTGRPLLIYSDRGSFNPRSAVEITNSTGKTLDGGPITVYQGGAYGGEALMETLKAGDKRLVSYAVDLGTRITTNFETGAGLVRQVTANRGILTSKTAIESTTTYSLTNVDAREKTVVIEHVVRSDFRLLKPTADEKTPNHYRFNVKIAARGSAKLVVVEEQTLEQSEAITSLTPDDLRIYTSSQGLSASGRKQLDAVLEKKRALAEAEGVEEQVNAQISEIVRDQERVRQNLNSLNRVSGQQEQVQRYVSELAQQDSQLAALRDRLAETRKRKVALDAELKSLIEKLQF